MLAQSLVGQASGNVIQSSLAHSAARGVGEVKTLLRAGAALWLAGVSIDWGRRYEGERRLKRPLPTYPFARQRYWAIDPDPPAVAPAASGGVGPGAGVVGGPPAPAPSDYLMETVSWRRVQYSVDEDQDRRRPSWLVFVARTELDERFADALSESGGKVTVVEKGAEFERLGDHRFSVDVNREADLNELCANAVMGLGPAQRLRVVYFCDPSRPRPAEAVAGEYRREVDDKINAPIVLIRTLMRHADAKNINLTFVTREAQAITGTETIDPMMSLPIGPCLAGMHEYPELRCRVVDIASSKADVEPLARQLAADIAEPSPSVITAYRGLTRWARSVERIPPFLLKSQHAKLRQNGVYLITGGLGDLGLAVAEHLAARYQAGLVLISRTPLPPREDWSRILAAAEDENWLVRMIRGVERVEAAGGQVIVGAADVCDLPQMQAVAREAFEKFGVIHGVIYAAGVSGNTPIGLKTSEEVDQVLHAEILGLAVLEQIFGDVRLDFLALFRRPARCGDASARPTTPPRTPISIRMRSPAPVGRNGRRSRSTGTIGAKSGWR